MRGRQTAAGGCGRLGPCVGRPGGRAMRAPARGHSQGDHRPGGRGGAHPDGRHWAGWSAGEERGASGREPNERMKKPTLSTRLPGKHTPGRRPALPLSLSLTLTNYTHTHTQLTRHYPSPVSIVLVPLVAARPALVKDGRPLVRRAQLHRVEIQADVAAFHARLVHGGPDAGGGDGGRVLRGVDQGLQLVAAAVVLVRGRAER